MSGLKPSHEVHGTLCRLRSTVVSVIVKLKKYGTRTLLSGQTEQQGKKRLCQGGDQDPMVTLVELQRSSADMREPSHSVNCALIVDWLTGWLFNTRKIYSHIGERGGCWTSSSTLFSLRQGWLATFNYLKHKILQQQLSSKFMHNYSKCWHAHACNKSSLTNLLPPVVLFTILYLSLIAVGVFLFVI